MNLRSPISSIIPSLDGAVLGALSGVQTPLTLSEIHRLVDHGSLSGVRLVLQRLVAAGVVHDVPGGYELNREHLAAPAISLLATLHGRLIERIREETERWDDVELIGLFGSAARRDGGEKSDIDLLVVSRSSLAEELVEDLARRIERWTGNRAHVFALTKERLRELDRVGEPLVQSWRDELVVIVGNERVLETVKK